MTLFADLSSGEVAAVVAAIVTPIGLAGGFLIKTLLAWNKERHSTNRTEKKEDERTIVQHQDLVIARQGRELDEVRAELSRHQGMINRLIGHFRYLEGILDQQQPPIEFKPFALDLLDTATRFATPNNPPAGGGQHGTD